MEQEYAILSQEQQDALNQKKVQMRLENEKYLRKHPELKQLVSCFMRKLLQDRPSNPVLYAGAFFTKPGLKQEVLSESTRIE